MAGRVGEPRLPRGSNKGQQAICHPERKAWCKRLCQVCYVKNRQQTRATRAKCHPDRPHYAHGLCRNCHRYRALRMIAPEKRQEKWRRATLKYKFGITPQDYDAMYAKQGGVCAICSGPFGNARWARAAIDHCHATGKVRGLLCGRCNSGLGYYEKYGAAFAEYLAKYG